MGRRRNPPSPPPASPPPPICIRCRRLLEFPEDEDGVSLSLDGPVMLQALREAREREQDGAAAEVLDAFAGALCPGCGRAL